MKAIAWSILAAAILLSSVIAKVNVDPDEPSPTYYTDLVLGFTFIVSLAGIIFS